MKLRSMITGLILFLVIPLTLGLHPFVKEALVVPVMYLTWITNLLWQWIPQSVLWYLFLVIPLFFFWRSLKRHSRPPQAATDDSGNVSGPVKLWAKRIREATAARDASTLNRLIGKLLFSILTYHSGKRPDQTRQAVKSGVSGLPAGLRTYLEPDSDTRLANPATPSLFSRLRSKAGKQPPTAIVPDPEATVSFMEDILEVKHDRS